MDLTEVLEIMEAELSQAQKAYNSVVLTERLRGKSNTNCEEERLAGIESAVGIFKAMYTLGKDDCLRCLKDKRISIRPGREKFFEGFDFILRLAELWKPK